MIALIPMSFYMFEKLKKEKPDIVHLFWGHYPSLVGYLVKKNMPDTKLSQFLGAYDLVLVKVYLKVLTLYLLMQK